MDRWTGPTRPDPDLADRVPVYREVNGAAVLATQLTAYLVMTW